MIVLVGMLEFDGSATADCLAKVILKIPMSFWQENTTNISGKAFQKASFQDDDGWSRITREKEFAYEMMILE